jgi:16S rRNA (guanine1516-N2)-methyltransferase
VTCVERIDALAAVLGLAIRESNRSAAHAQALEGRMAVMHGDAKEVIQRRVVDADVIYIDPMFEPRKGSALPKKPAQLLHRFAGQDLDAPALLQVAREACHRVIVKRPNDGPVLAPDPPLTFGSRLVRYDVYLQTDKRSIQ